MKYTLLAVLLLASTFAYAGPRTGHHGDFVVVCHKPKFMQETPTANSEVNKFQNFNFWTSENTDADTLKVWVNNQLVDVKKDRKGSGNYHIIGKLPEPIREGKAWVKVTSESHDGCNDLKAWNVYIKN
ncbi:MAG: hypothetical protein FJ190_02260 [Gammaproteobacteria bacterium]|nr:hypothetical protein [Gammaproteobacteria bacterium]